MEKASLFKNWDVNSICQVLTIYPLKCLSRALYCPIYPTWILKSSLALHCQIHLESWVLGVHQKRCVLLPLSAQSTLLSHRLQGEQLLSLPLETLRAVDWLQPCLQLKAFLWKRFAALLLWQRVQSSARFCLFSLLFIVANLVFGFVNCSTP